MTSLKRNTEGKRGGRGGRRQEAEKLLLTRRQRVEARHDVTPRLRERVAARAQPVGCRTLDHAVVGDAQFGKAFAQPAVDRPQGLPDGQEPPLLGRKVGLVAQRGPEGLHDLQLARREVGDVGLQLLEIRNVAEEPVGIHAVFVDRVEVRQEHVAPEVELVEGFGVVLCVDFVELRNEPHAVPGVQSRDLAHQVVDRRPRRLPHRALGDLRQRIDEEQPRTTRREEHETLRQTLPVTGIEVRSNFVQKTLHGWPVLTPRCG